MRMITLVRHYLMPYSRYFALFTLSFMLSVCAYAKLNVSPLFIQVSDAMAEIKQGEPAKSVPILTDLQQQFFALESHHSEMGKQVEQALASAISTPNLDRLEQLSKALLAFEKEQNPVDYTQKRNQFAKRVMPVYDKLHQAVMAHDLDAVQNEYKRFNTTWSLNEMPVRETSLGHYGQIETAMTFLRVAMLAEPANFTEMEKQSEQLGKALNDFKAGNVLQPQVSQAENAPQNLASGLKLLEKAYANFEQGDLEQGRADISLFIQQWAIFEGEVSTRSAELYQRIESDLPVIFAKANEAENMQYFKALIDEISQLDTGGSYGIIDAMLILLREGVEALLIIMALLTTLNAANQPRAKRWVYSGAGLGIAASVLGAVALQQFFPAVSAGTNREILEGAVGVIAVVMMLMVGAWLHSKSSISGWKRFMQGQVAKAVATGSLMSMLSLSFLSVFREGAETILFYVGMLPLIELNDLLSGIGLALLLLAILVMVLHKSTAKLPIHHLFKLMTVLIYGLAFKILGVSIHALQLTNILPNHLIEGLSNVPTIGFYANWECVVAQLIYLALIPVVTRLFGQAKLP